MVPLTITETGYSFTTSMLEQYDRPFGGILIDFLDTDFTEIFEKIDIYSDEFSFMDRTKQGEDADEYYETLTDKFELEKKYSPIITNLTVSQIETTERWYFASGQNYNKKELNEKLKAIHELFPQLQAVIPSILDSSNSNISPTIRAIYNNLFMFQSIQTYFNITDYGFSQMYSVSDIVSMLALEIYQINYHKIKITKCRNCGRYFIPQIRSDEIYCDRLFKNGKTCKDVGYIRNADEFQKAYRTAYKTQKARCRYHQESNPNYEQQHFAPWNKAALSAKKEFQDKNDIDGFRKWLKDNGNAF